MKTTQYFNKKDELLDSIIDICNWLNADQSVEEVLSKHKKVKVTIEKAESKRSVAANSFYWAVIVSGFCEQLWPDYTKEMVHLTLGEAFRKTRKPQHIIDREIAEGRHNTEWFIPSTSRDNTFEFWMYVEKCLNAFIEAGGSIDISDAREYKEIKEMY